MLDLKDEWSTTPYHCLQQIYESMIAVHAPTQAEIVFITLVKTVPTSVIFHSRYNISARQRAKKVNPPAASLDTC